MPDTLPCLVLASSSPRRKQILGLLGAPFRVLAVPVPEQSLAGEAPLAVVRRLSLAKAEATAAEAGEGVIVGSDTIVVLDGAVLGKPSDAGEATTMLRALRGRFHEVITGVAVLNLANGKSVASTTTTRVLMRRYRDEEIAAYVASGEPFDKAGAYAVQSAAFRPAEQVKGCYLNVVGLPLCALAANLCAAGYPTPALPPDRLIDVCPRCPERGTLARGCS